MTLNYFRNGQYEWGEVFAGTLAAAKRLIDSQFDGQFLPEARASVTNCYTCMNIESDGGTVLYVRKLRHQSE